MSTEKLKELLYARIIIDSHKTANIDKSYAYRDGANSLAERVLKLAEALERIKDRCISDMKKANGSCAMLSGAALNELYKDLGGLD